MQASHFLQSKTKNRISLNWTLLLKVIPGMGQHMGTLHCPVCPRITRQYVCIWQIQYRYLLDFIYFLVPSIVWGRGNLGCCWAFVVWEILLCRNGWWRICRNIVCFYLVGAFQITGTSTRPFQLTVDKLEKALQDARSEVSVAEPGLVGTIGGVCRRKWGCRSRRMKKRWADFNCEF